MEHQARTKTKPRKQQPRRELEPISYEEIMGNAGMSGFVSFLDAPEAPPNSGTVLSGDTVQDSLTVITADTVAETVSVLESNAVEGAGAVTESIAVKETAKESTQALTVEQAITAQEAYTVQGLSRARGRIRRTQNVADGHSLAEQEVYRTLWQAADPEDAEAGASRTLRIGYDRLANLVRLSWVTVKANLRTLERKLAIDVLQAENSANREGKRYRIYSEPAILARREAAGLRWVRRSRGVELLTSASLGTIPTTGTRK